MLHDLSPVPLWPPLVEPTAPTIRSLDYFSKAPRMLRSLGTPVPLWKVPPLDIGLVLFLTVFKSFLKATWPDKSFLKSNPPYCTYFSPPILPLFLCYALCLWSAPNWNISSLRVGILFVFCAAASQWRECSSSVNLYWLSGCMAWMKQREMPVSQVWLSEITALYSLEHRGTQNSEHRGAFLATNAELTEF